MLSTFAGKRIFITGGTGFFGRTLLDRLAGSGAELWVLTRKPEALAGISGVRPVAGDILNCRLPAIEADYLIHAASCPSSSADIVKFTVRAAERMIEFAACSGAKTLFLSSGAVYGIFDAPVSELVPPCPATPYGRAKFYAEQLYCESGLPVAIARCFSFIGRHIGLDSPYAASDFLRAAVAGNPPEIEGNRGTVRSYLDAREWADWCLALLAGASGIYNVGSDRPVTIGELAGLIARGGEVRDRGNGPASFYVPDTEKIKCELSVAQKISLKDAIGDVLDWYLKP